MHKRKRFGEILVESEVITEDILAQALERQKASGKRLGRVLEDMGVVSEKDVAVTLARQFGFKRVQNLTRYSFSEEVLGLVTSEEALQKGIFPLKVEEKTVYVAMVNPLDMEAADDLSFRTRLRVIPCVTTSGEIQAAVHEHYLGGRPKEEGGTANWWTILVVDDQELARTAVSRALKQEGFDVIEAEDGAAGVKHAVTNSPHLIVLDTVMPRLDGYGMFRILLNNKATRNIPVIGLSNKAAPEEEARLLDAGYFDFIPKPVNPIRLVARVKRSLRIAYGDGQPPV